ENVIYSQEDTLQSIVETRSKTEPVMRNIEPGTRVIKKGFIITEDDMTELKALRMTMPANDLPIIFADLLFLLLLFALLCYFSGSRIIGRDLTDRETYLVAGLSALYIAGSIIIRNASLEYIPSSIMIPTALVMMLPAILIHSRLALVLAMTLPVGAFLTGSFDTSSYIFALVSGVVATYSLQGAEKRMDLVKAGLFIAGANLVAIVSILLWQRSPAVAYPGSIFWAIFNGIACGMLVLGVLPPLEHALNAATTFRLIELCDLNAPILRRLFTAAPGTYSHSIMVANLAEAACQDIGANPLLARVGAYYHDLGKMENPDYFVENQSDYNRHDDIAPRLSATVLRSHVKMGVEKARQLGLPLEVIDIIGEHHGNSVITWFYSKALKQENIDLKRNPINIEDFTYPGSPPRSRESAVVMLADVTEAAVRTLDKPTAVKIEKFIQELIAGKVEHGQLSQSELTFRDLETIKKAFVRVLAGYYHSRIEYPKIYESKDNADNSVPEANGTTGK
ncbi:MAG: HDIG domain-containing protein, partial [Treponema sp.]|nr:HDIG domain-containing protein [Treponema sp.]